MLTDDFEVVLTVGVGVGVDVGNSDVLIKRVDAVDESNEELLVGLVPFDCVELTLGTVVCATVVSVLGAGVADEPVPDDRLPVDVLVKVLEWVLVALVAPLVLVDVLVLADVLGSVVG